MTRQRWLILLLVVGGLWYWLDEPRTIDDAKQAFERNINGFVGGIRMMGVPINQKTQKDLNEVNQGLKVSN